MKEERRRSPRILAIDPGSKHLGFAHMLGDTILMSGVIDLYGNVPKTYYTLYYWMRLQLEGIVHESGIKLVPEHVIIESYFPHNRHGATVIPELRGIIKLACYQNKHDVLEIPPNTVKKYVTGNGRASKEEVRKVVNARYDLSIKSMDQSDAIAIGLTGLSKIAERDDVAI